AIDFLNYGLYKKKSTIKDLEEENKELKSQIKKFGKEKEKLIKKTQSLGAKKPKKWLSHSTLSTWHQEVANLEVHSTITQLSEVNSYGIMVDESTCGENKYLVIVFAFWSYVENFPLAKVIELKVISKHDSVTIATNVLNLIEEKKLDPKACSVWITDNTAYNDEVVEACIFTSEREHVSEDKTTSALELFHIPFELTVTR
ncbi:4367_t:CDS:2, partial [Entrophospora sp. SA101]